MKKKMPNSPPLPPPLSPLPRLFPARPVKVKSVTRDEIARFWRRKKIEEEDHLLAAIKAAARIRARRLMEEDSVLFEEALNKNEDEKEKKNGDKNEDENGEIRVGIKDWWTKSKYAYLNQPTLNSMEKPKVMTSTSTSTPPNLCFYKPPPPTHAVSCLLSLNNSCLLFTS